MMRARECRDREPRLLSAPTAAQAVDWTGRTNLRPGTCWVRRVPASTISLLGRANRIAGGDGKQTQGGGTVQEVGASGWEAAAPVLSRWPLPQVVG